MVSEQSVTRQWAGQDRPDWLPCSVATSTGHVLTLAGHDVAITHPEKVVFPELGVTKLDLVEHYLAVAEGALRGVAGRPMVLKRFVKGIAEEAVFQKRAPTKRPEWLEVAELRYASGTSAAETVVRDTAGLAYVVNLNCIDLNPHPVLAEDLDHPVELRIDLDPVPGVPWGQIVDVAFVVREVLLDHGLTAWPKTSGSRGIHVYAPVHHEPGVQVWTYPQLRRAAETVAREVENRAPDLATSRWWKEEREGVFVDFNQNAKDRTVASAWSVRATPDARVSMPLTWDEVRDVDPAEHTIRTAAGRFAEIGDPWAGMDDVAGSLQPLLDLAKALGPAEKPPKGTGRRTMTMPLVEIARTRTKPEALDLVQVWRDAHPAVAAHLHEADVLVDGMRGSSSLWYRVRINLQHVPEEQRPEQGDLLADYNPWTNYRGPQRPS
ncbi:DNA polymerase domain-containing protein [Kineococcus gynurae]|uniref:DNA polymerase domain-containing protein n=1 Tax=Kineococcus gynurae TaxID=452979 RepID=A0ABV5LQ28_9ACTN